MYLCIYYLKNTICYNTHISIANPLTHSIPEENSLN